MPDRLPPKLLPKPAARSTQTHSRATRAASRSSDAEAARVMAIVAAECGVSFTDLKLATRGSPQKAQVRQIAMYLCHVACGMTFSIAGAAFGRDRTTVAHACRVVEDRRDDPSFERMLVQLEQRCAPLREKAAA